MWKSMYSFVSEMKPAWYNIEDIPFGKMWPDDHLWFPYMLKGVPFYGYFQFQGMDTVVDYVLKEVADIHTVEIPSGPTPLRS